MITSDEPQIILVVDEEKIKNQYDMNQVKLYLIGEKHDVQKKVGVRLIRD